MKIDVYDTYATSKNGNMIHFDVFVEHGALGSRAFNYAKQFIKEIGEDENALTQSRCNFCHTEVARPHIQETIRREGYYILQMEGCPKSGK